MLRVCVWMASLFSVTSLMGVEYVEAVEGAAVSCPLVELKGKIFQHTFPGVPNYQSVEEGDAPEIRWVLEIPSSEIRRLEQAGFIPQNDIFSSADSGLVQVISPQNEDEPAPFLNRCVIVKGYLGSLIFHVHTPNSY
jgi:hypothetical protein